MPGNSSAPAARLGWAGLRCPSLPLPGNRSGRGNVPPVLLSILGYRPQHSLRCSVRFGSGLWAASSAFPVYSPRTLPAASRREILSFALPKQAHVQVSPASLSLALPAGLRNFCRGSAGLLFAFFKALRFIIFFPSVISHSLQSARTGRTLGRAAPFRCCLAWKAKDGLEIRQHF